MERSEDSGYHKIMLVRSNNNNLRQRRFEKDYRIETVWKQTKGKSEKEVGISNWKEYHEYGNTGMEGANPGQEQIVENNRRRKDHKEMGKCI